MIELLKQTVQGNVSTTLAQFSDLEFSRFGLRVSKNTSKNWLDGELFPVKKVQPVIQNVKNQVNETEQRECIENLLNARSGGRTVI